METVAFNSIGFYAALILNRLHNERALAEIDEAKDQAAGVKQAADRDGRRGEDDCESAQSAMIILNKKRSA